MERTLILFLFIFCLFATEASCEVSTIKLKNNILTGLSNNKKVTTILFNNTPLSDITLSILKTSYNSLYKSDKKLIPAFKIKIPYQKKFFLDNSNEVKIKPIYDQKHIYHNIDFLTPVIVSETLSNFNIPTVAYQLIVLEYNKKKSLSYLVQKSTSKNLKQLSPEQTLEILLRNLFISLLISNSDSIFKPNIENFTYMNYENKILIKEIDLDWALSTNTLLEIFNKKNSDKEFKILFDLIKKIRTDNKIQSQVLMNFYNNKDFLQQFKKTLSANLKINLKKLKQLCSIKELSINYPIKCSNNSLNHQKKSIENKISNLDEVFSLFIKSILDLD